MLAAASDTAVVFSLTSSDVTAVSSMYLWINDNNNNKIVGYSDFTDNNESGPSITDALLYTDEDGNVWYLIPISYFTDALGIYGYTLDTSECPFQYAPSAYYPQSNKTDAYYAEVDGSYYVCVQDTTNLEPARTNIYYTGSTSVMVEGVSPSGTTINLFDYWTTGQDDVDVGTNSLMGINTGHALKFSYNGRQKVATDVFGNLLNFNLYTKSKTPYSGIVENLLYDGYPYLSSAIPDDVGSSTTYGESDYTAESLAYLFDPEYTQDGKASYAGVQNLLQLDEDGYYYYNSAANYAEYDESTNSFILHKDTAVSGSFFPFNSFDSVSSITSPENTAINHYFGLSLTTNFLQAYNGHTTLDETQETTFEFSGDDDVWIYIDDVLVADLGGIHGAATVTINFATGVITINGEEAGTLYEAYEAAGATTYTTWNGDTFADGTYHKLSFFYLERGNSSSNLMIKYNQIEVVELPGAPYDFSFVKIDGDFEGDAAEADTISDVSFSIYYADSAEDGYTRGDYIGDAASSCDGIVLFETLDTGTYWIDETSSLNGYKNPGWHWIVGVGKYGSITLIPVYNTETAYANIYTGINGDGNTVYYWPNYQEEEPTEQEPQYYTFSFCKIDGSSSITPETALTLPGAVFALYGTIGNNGDITRGEPIQNPDNTGDYTATSSGDGLVVFTGLEAGTVYWLEEADAPEGYEVSEWHWLISVDGSGNITVAEAGAEEGITGLYQNGDIYYWPDYTEPSPVGSIKIVKRGADGELLEGVTFALYNAAGEEVGEKATDENGEILFSGLEPDIYTLTETKTVSGYTLLAESINITIPLALSDEEAKLYSNGADLEEIGTYDEDEEVWYFYNLTYTIGNAKLLEMPESGNVFPYLQFSGGMASVAAGVCLGFGRRRRSACLSREGKRPHFQ